MAIVAADLVLVASERMTDNLSQTAGVGGGGERGTVIVQDGVSNNVFPDVMPADRITGRVQVRLVYPSVLSADNDMLSNAGFALLERPTDPLVEMCALGFSTAAPFSKRSYDATLAVQRYPFPTEVSNQLPPGNGTRHSTIANRVEAAGHDYQVGEFVHVVRADASALVYEDIDATWRKVTAVSAGLWFEFSGAVPSAFIPVAALRHGRPGFGTGRVSAAALLETGVSSGATQLDLDRVEVRVIPTGAGPTTPGLASAAYLADLSGKQPAFVPGELLLIQHASTPATWEVKQIQAVNFIDGTVTLVGTLANAYPVGSKVAMLLRMGDLRAQLGITPFSQQVWSRSWADVRSGPAINANYNGAVALTNEGAIDERWALVFKTATTFDLLSERFGQLASGSVSTNFMPLNPMTNEPYFTLFAAGWGTGWLPGNTLRFNTKAAAFPIWMVRCTSPGAASGTVVPKAVIYGDVNA